jgi:hypothetical protein
LWVKPFAHRKDGHYRQLDNSHNGLKVISEYTADSPRWRDYLFQRYVEIISKEAIYQLGKTNTALSADEVIRQLDDVTTRVHDQAAKDLNSFLFEETLQAGTN